MMRYTLLILYAIASVSCFSKQIRPLNHNQELSRQTKSSSLLSSFSVYRENQVWVLLKNGQMLCSKDKGDSWEVISKNTSEMFTLVNFINDKDGWALSSQQNIWKSNDGGNTWDKLSTLPKNNEIEHFKEVLFCDKQIGYILGTSYVWSTTDGGVTWTKSSPANEDEDYYGWLHNLSFPRAKLGWVTSSKGIFKTIDGGQTWLAVRMFYNKELSLDTNDVYWLNDKVGWVIYDGLYKTINGGTSWHDVSPPDDLIVTIISYSFINENYGLVLGEDVNILQAENTHQIESFSTLASTSDSGKSWQLIPIPKSEKFSKVLLTSRLNGWLIGYDKLYFTQDSGKTWKLSLLFSDYIK